MALEKLEGGLMKISKREARAILAAAQALEHEAGDRFVEATEIGSDDRARMRYLNRRGTELQRLAKRLRAIVPEGWV